MKLEGLTVDGSEEKEKIRELVAGLRLLSLYGRAAQRALRLLRSGKDVDAMLPLVERPPRSKGRYEVTVVPVHTSVAIPSLPSYDGLTFRLERHKDDSGSLVWIRTLDAGLTVRAHGRVIRGALEGIIGSVRTTKGGFAWSFKQESRSRRTQDSVNRGIAHLSAMCIVKMDFDHGIGRPWHSKAKQVYDALKARSEARLLLDGHADRIRKEVEASLTVDAVHAL